MSSTHHPLALHIGHDLSNTACVLGISKSASSCMSDVVLLDSSKPSEGGTGVKQKVYTSIYHLSGVDTSTY